MITTGRLVNTPITHHLTTCVCVLKTFKIYSLSNLQEYNHSVISQNHHAMQHLPDLLILYLEFCVFQTPVPVPPLPHFHPHPHTPFYSFCEFIFFLFRFHL